MALEMNCVIKVPARSPWALRTALMSPDTSAWTTAEMRGCWIKPRGSLSGLGIGVTSAFGSRVVLSGITLETAPVERFKTDWRIWPRILLENRSRREDSDAPLPFFPPFPSFPLAFPSFPFPCLSNCGVLKLLPPNRVIAPFPPFPPKSPELPMSDEANSFPPFPSLPPFPLPGKPYTPPEFIRWDSPPSPGGDYAAEPGSPPAPPRRFNIPPGEFPAKVDKAPAFPSRPDSPPRLDNPPVPKT